MSVGKAWCDQRRAQVLWICQFLVPCIMTSMRRWWMISGQARRPRRRAEPRALLAGAGPSRSALSPRTWSWPSAPTRAVRGDVHRLRAALLGGQPGPVHQCAPDNLPEL